MIKRLLLKCYDEYIDSNTVLIVDCRALRMLAVRARNTGKLRLTVLGKAFRER
jgi:hypothetical protein